ncbi:MAG: metal-sulfur cluster assembly factor [Litorilinea sp.]
MTETLNTGTLTAAQCWEYLKAVIDPEIYQNIIDLGLVYDVEVTPEQDVTVKMTLTTPHCPMGPQIIENVENTLAAKGARSVDVRIVWEPMWTPDAMTEELKRELGIIPDTDDADSQSAAADEEEPVLEIDPPPPPPKKKGLLGRLFGN